MMGLTGKIVIVLQIFIPGLTIKIFHTKFMTEYRKMLVSIVSDNLSQCSEIHNGSNL